MLSVKWKTDTMIEKKNPLFCTQSESLLKEIWQQSQLLFMYNFFDKASNQIKDLVDVFIASVLQHTVIELHNYYLHEAKSQ